MARKAFDKIMAGLTEAVEIAEGRADPATYRVHPPVEVDVKAVRTGLGLSQADFGAKFGLPVGNIRDWEQGRSKPDQAARMLILTIKRAPNVVAAALAAEMEAQGLRR
jgi:putative transcriptional regulator